jgi:hypothetical protein
MRIPETLMAPLKAADVAFVVMLICSLLFATAAVMSGFERREALVHREGGRKVDAERIRKQISEGSLSPRKALFFKKAPR